VNAAEAAAAAALAEIGDAVPEVPTHGQEMGETGIAGADVANTGQS
jgi:hypothetical protein